VLPPCRQPSQVSRRCSLSRPRAQRLSRTANRWCGHRCPCDKRVRTSHPSAGTRRAQTEGWSDPVCCLIRPRISHALMGLRRVIRLRGLDR
jgi:hypothetical protein